MSYASFAPSPTLPASLQLDWLRLAGRSATWLAKGISFAATLYLCVAWPGLTP